MWQPRLAPLTRFLLATERSGASGRYTPHSEVQQRERARVARQKEPMKWSWITRVAAAGPGPRGAAGVSGTPRASVAATFSTVCATALRCKSILAGRGLLARRPPRPRVRCRSHDRARASWCWVRRAVTPPGPVSGISSVPPLVPDRARRSITWHASTTTTLRAAHRGEGRWPARKPQEASFSACRSPMGASAGATAAPSPSVPCRS